MAEALSRVVPDSNRGITYQFAINSRSDRSGVGAGDHGADWASIDGDGSTIYSRWELVSGERGGEGGVVERLSVILLQWSAAAHCSG